MRIAAAIALACLGTWLAWDHDWSRAGVLMGLASYLVAALLLVEWERA